MTDRAAAAARVVVEVDGRRLALSNLDKTLYPETGFTKAALLDYYTRVAPVLLPHISGRPITLKRYPDGVDGSSFFAKNAPGHTPDWVRTVRLPSPGSSKNRDEIDYVVVDDLPTLVWAANLAAIELHAPLWRVGTDGRPQSPDLLVFDLDPGPPAGIMQCCEVAALLREHLRADGIEPVAKTSGSKGLQLYAAVTGATSEATSAYAHALARRLERQHPDLVVSRMTKALRPGKVLVDWSQNNAAKTTVAVYAARARPRPTVSTPLRWQEIVACGSAEELSFTTGEVLERVEGLGDLFAPLLGAGVPLPAAPDIAAR